MCTERHDCTIDRLLKARTYVRDTTSDGNRSIEPARTTYLEYSSRTEPICMLLCCAFTSACGCYFSCMRLFRLFFFPFPDEETAKRLSCEFSLPSGNFRLCILLEPDEETPKRLHLHQITSICRSAHVVFRRESKKTKIIRMKTTCMRWSIYCLLTLASYH